MTSPLKAPMVFGWLLSSPSLTCFFPVPLCVQHRLPQETFSRCGSEAGLPSLLHRPPFSLTSSPREPTGTVVQTISIPSTGASSQCTLSGTGVGEGLLTTSFDGQFASFACYMAASGTANVVTALLGNRAVINVHPSGVTSTRVGLGPATYSGPSRAVFGAVVMDTSGNWYSTGRAASVRGISYNSAVGSL